MAARKKAQAKRVVKPSRFKMVEVTIVGSAPGAADVLQACIGLAHEGISATVKLPGVTGTVVVK